MGDTSNIAWTRSTFNPWIGCTKVGPGCDACYAEALDKRMQFGGGLHWGAGVPRHRTSASYWKKPLQWNRLAGAYKSAGVGFAGRPGFWPVFCASLADVFDNEVPVEWRDDLFSMIEHTPHLSWLLVTKRIVNVPKLAWPRWMTAGFPENVRIMVTVVNQEEADRDIPKLLALPCKNGISYEPALGPVDWTPYFPPHNWDRIAGRGDGFAYPFRGLEWVIVGGESSQGKNKARPFNIEWARNTVAQCKAAEVPVFVKQLGSLPKEEGCEAGSVWVGRNPRSLQRLHDRAGADPSEWPEDFRVREFPL